MSEVRLRQPGFPYSACGAFTKSKEWIQKCKETGDSQYIYQNERDKAFFQHEMFYGDFKDLNGRAASDKVLGDKTFNFVKNPRYDGYQCGLASMVYKFFDKKTSDGTGKNENISNKELAEELKKTIIKNFKKRTVQSPFIDNIWGADLVDVQLTSKFNKGIHFLLCAIDIYSKYPWFKR